PLPAPPIQSAPPTPPSQPTPPTQPTNQLNPHTITKLLHVFFTEDELNRLAQNWGEQYGRFQPTSQQPLHPLVVKRKQKGDLQQLIDVAQKLHP
ncbi:MAG: hypothetical protein KC421_14715, partial [Anaerolineales bacterium]|nr:hypothetical protein [Anaerolineales bacterium]